MKPLQRNKNLIKKNRLKRIYLWVVRFLKQRNTVVFLIAKIAQRSMILQHLRVRFYVIYPLWTLKHRAKSLGESLPMGASGDCIIIKSVLEAKDSLKLISKIFSKTEKTYSKRQKSEEDKFKLFKLFYLFFQKRSIHHNGIQTPQNLSRSCA